MMMMIPSSATALKSGKVIQPAPDRPRNPWPSLVEIKGNRMRIAMLTQTWKAEPEIGDSGELWHASSVDQPATLVVGDDRGWWPLADLLPSALARQVLHGNAGDALRCIRVWDQLKSQFTLPPSQPTVAMDELRFLPPVVGPQKVICIGLNYADHAAETGADKPTLPVVFNKFPSTLIAHQQPIVLPPISEKVDFEAELVVVIGKPGKDIPEDDAWDHVFGFTCGHDVSARDWQKGRPGGQWLLGKTFDHFAPLGPALVTADQLDPSDLAITFRLNGEVMQESSTRHFIFSIPHLISHLSQFCTLLPGDLLFTGTPSGVGVARNPAVFMKAGDRAEVEIEGIGTLANPVV